MEFFTVLIVNCKQTFINQKPKISPSKIYIPGNTGRKISQESPQKKKDKAKK